MGRTFYVDSIHGSDNNSGTSADLAFQTISKLETVKFQPGDQLLLARGSVFRDQLDINASGTTLAPIKISSYGNGALPVISGGYRGIDARGADNIVVENIAVSNTTHDGIYGLGADNWIIRGVEFDNIGLSTGHGGISWWNSSNLLVENSTFTNVYGDGIWGQGMNGITLNNNLIHTVLGAASDTVQVEQSQNIRITNNRLEMNGATDSGKGTLVIQKSTSTLVEGNTMVGGYFGASLTTNDARVINNHFEDQNKTSWSAGIVIGQAWDASNIEIGGNTFKNSNNGISIAGEGNYQRNNITVHHNVFSNISDSVFKDYSPTSGSFEHNIIATPSGMRAPTVLSGPWTQTSNWYATGSWFTFGSQTFKTLDAFQKASGYDLNSSTGSVPPSGDGTLIVRVSGDQYNGLPQLQLFVDGKQIGTSYSVSAAHSLGQWQDIKVSGSFDPALAHKVQVRFINDAFDSSSGADRNIYIDSVTLNGVIINPAEDVALYTVSSTSFDFPSKASAVGQVTGTNADDTLAGTTGSDRISGLAGNDTLAAREGNDFLIGGAGHDSLSGQAGNDTFVFISFQDSTPGTANRDRIIDWGDGVNTFGNDLIDLGTIDANAAVIGNQAFVWIGTASFAGKAGELRSYFDGINTIVEGTINADLTADFQIQISGEHNLRAEDFVL